MAEIKSALEIALARTEDVQSNKGKLLEHDTRREGKRIASKFLNALEGERENIRKKIESYERMKQQWIREGIFTTLLSNLSLPQTDLEMEKIDLIERAFIDTVGEKKQISGMFQQLKQFFTQYQQNAEQLIKQLEQEYAPRFKEKTRELSEKIGAEVALDVHSDPEFLNLLKQNQSRLDEQFQEALENFKQQLAALANIKV